MKKIFFIVIYAIVTVMLYLLGCFIEADLDISVWDIKLRTLIAFVDFILLALGTSFYIDKFTRL